MAPTTKIYNKPRTTLIILDDDLGVIAKQKVMLLLREKGIEGGLTTEKLDGKRRQAIQFEMPEDWKSRDLTRLQEEIIREIDGD